MSEKVKHDIEALKNDVFWLREESRILKSRISTVEKVLEQAVKKK